MLTVRDLEDDKVRALEAGADDYVTKPFRLRELTARLRSVLRRTRAQEAAEPIVLQAGNLRIDLERRLLLRGEEEIHLSPTEFDLLALMMKHAGAPLTHIKLLRSIWGPEYGGELEYLRSYVRMLRKKIENNPAKPEYILTEPWVGYRFVIRLILIHYPSPMYNRIQALPPSGRFHLSRRILCPICTHWNLCRRPKWSAPPHFCGLCLNSRPPHA
jgi:DNA-binding response OmpR family regulator